MRIGNFGVKRNYKIIQMFLDVVALIVYVAIVTNTFALSDSFRNSMKSIIRITKWVRILMSLYSGCLLCFGQLLDWD